MKTILLLSAILIFTSCSKSKDDVPQKETVTFNAGAINYQGPNTEYLWKVILNTDKPVSLSGSVTVSWDIYSGSSLMEAKTVTFTYNKVPSHTFTYETGIETRHGYSARNVKITALTASTSDYILAY